MYCHIEDDITRKGTTGNYSTRPGEGFIQEAKEAYHQTNGKDAEQQVRLPLVAEYGLFTNFTLDGQN